jgi:hypothetical protein
MEEAVGPLRGKSETEGGTSNVQHRTSKGCRATPGNSAAIHPLYHRERERVRGREDCQLHTPRVARSKGAVQ